MARNAIRWFASSFDVQAATSFRNCTCDPRTRPYHSIIWSRRLVFSVRWWSLGLMLVVEVVVMVLSLSFLAASLRQLRSYQNQACDVMRCRLLVDRVTSRQHKF